MRSPAPLRYAVDLTGVGDVVGGSAHARGVEYAHQGRVLQLLWDADSGSLLGSVGGSGGRRYTTTARLSPGPLGQWVLTGGECSCPINRDCKHVAALVLAAAGAAGPEPAAAPEPTWERSLGSLLDPGPAPTRTPLAIELSLARDRTLGEAPRPPRLMARPVRPGKRGGWIAGNLTWNGLDGLNRYSYDQSYDDTQVQLLRELYALYTASADTAYALYRYGYGNEKSIEISAVESAQLWPLLAEARKSGLRLLHSGRHHGDVDPVGTAEVCLDVTGSPSLAVQPTLRVDDQVGAVAVRFMGTHGHGVVHHDSAEPADPASWRFGLARLERPVPPPLQELVLSAQPLRIPAAEAGRFRDEYYPRLRHTAAVISSDESFTPPPITGPVLGLSARYEGEHELDLSWEWAYQVGDTQRRTPTDAPAGVEGYRDPEAERALVRGLEEPLEDFGLRIGGRLMHARLGGIDTMRFSTEVLPLLAERAEVSVEVSGSPADYREVGDSLVIGVSTFAITGETDWFDLGVSISAEGRTVPFVQVFGALAAGDSCLLLADGAYFSLDKPELVRLRALIEEARALSDGPDDRLTISRYQAELFDELAELGVVKRQAAEWKRQVEGLRAISSVSAEPTPPDLHATLRPYQSEGFGWLALLWKYRLGGILADDMGLGKTLQSLALICHAKAAEDPGPFLIIAPSSVVSNWVAETGRFAPDLRVIEITDTLRRSGAKLGELVAGADLVVTSYTLFRLDFDAYSKQRWAGLILDEAQYVKNHQGKTYQCARRLAAPFKLAITGTPMENNLMELWSLLSITAPGLFPSPKRFAEYYAQPIEKGTDAELLGQLRHRIKPLVMRRTKELVAADLPAKQEQVIEVPLHHRHRTVYQRRLQRERQKVLGLLDDVDKNRFTILRSLTILRQLSLHAGLVEAEHAGLPCAKLDALMELLRDVTEGGHRALVFSQFTGFLAHVRKRLDAAGVGYCYLDGRTRKRAAVINEFKEGTDPVFLISLKAGGFGLNLTEADYCFLLDPWWNPATEAQAVDRTHRIGQTRNVMVYRLLSADTIEQKVTALKDRKAKLFTSVMDDGNAFGSALDAEDIRGLLA